MLGLIHLPPGPRQPGGYPSKELALAGRDPPSGQAEWRRINIYILYCSYFFC
jgi:hypothetical protein